MSGFLSPYITEVKDGDYFIARGRIAMKLGTKWLVVLLLFCMTFSPFAQGTQGKNLKDTVTVVLKGEPSNIDPHGNGELVAFTTQMQIYDNLLKKDANGAIVPELATKWQVIDKQTIRFFLREDVYFHNGEKLTAEDVRFSIARATQKPSSSAIFKGFDGEKTKVVNDYTIDIVTKGPFAGIYNYLCSSRGNILSKKAVMEMGDAKFGRNPVGSGPFVFDTWRTGTDIKLVRNEKYWGTKPAFSTMILKFVPETASRAIEIESGNADVIFDPDPADIPRLSKNKNLKVISGPSYANSYIVFKMSDQVFSDIKLRQALSLALNKAGIVQAIYGELGKPSQSVFASTIFSYKPMGVTEYNVEKAAALMKEAGYKNGLDVVLATPNTKQLMDIAEIAQNMWKKIGVNATIKTTAMAEFLAAGRRGENQIAISAANYTTGDPGHALADFDTRSDGFFKPIDKKIDAYLDQGASTFETEARKKVYQEVQQYIYNQYYMLPIADTNVNYVTTNKVENFFCDPGNSPYLGDIKVYQ